MQQFTDIESEFDEIKRRPKKKYDRSLKVKIYIFELNDDVPIREHEVDLHDRDQREWLLKKCLVWACLNHKAVEIIHVEDDE